jgi:predicted kinase
MPIYSPDAFLERDGPYRWSPSRVLEAWAWVMAQLQALPPGRLVALVGLPGSGKSSWLAENADPDVIYLDSTLTRRKARRELEQGLPGWRVEYIWMDTPVEQCIARDALRPPGRAVGEERIRAMDRRLRGSPPIPEEGLVRVIRSV